MEPKESSEGNQPLRHENKTFFQDKSNESAGSDLNSGVIFNEMENRRKAQPGMAKKVNAIFLWNITKNGKVAGQWSKCFYVQKFYTVGHCNAWMYITPSITPPLAAKLFV